MCTLLLVAVLAACISPLAPAQIEEVRGADVQYAVFYYEGAAPRTWDLKPKAAVSASVPARKLRLAPLPYEEQSDAGLSMNGHGLSYGIISYDGSTLRGRAWRPTTPIEPRQRRILGIALTFTIPAGR